MMREVGQPEGSLIGCRREGWCEVTGPVFLQANLGRGGLISLAKLPFLWAHHVQGTELLSAAIAKS
jgi:hypothetical protein